MVDNECIKDIRALPPPTERCDTGRKAFSRAGKTVVILHLRMPLIITMLLFRAIENKNIEQMTLTVSYYKLSYSLGGSRNNRRISGSKIFAISIVLLRHSAPKLSDYHN